LPLPAPDADEPSIDLTTPTAPAAALSGYGTAPGHCRKRIKSHDREVGDLDTEPADAMRAAAAAAATAGCPCKQARFGPLSSLCPLCGGRFNRRTELDVHAEECDGILRERCPLCSKFLLPAHLQAHVSDCGNVACRVCGRRVPLDEIGSHESRCRQTEVDSTKDEQLAMQLQRELMPVGLLNDRHPVRCDR
jgi:hypothetical protein